MIGSFTFKGNSVPINSHTAFPLKFLLALSSLQSLSRVRLFVTPWTAACQASLSITNSRSLLNLMPIELVMPSNHLILCRPLLLPPSVFPTSGSFQMSGLCIRWPKYWSFSFNIRQKGLDCKQTVPTKCGGTQRREPL